MLSGYVGKSVTAVKRSLAVFLVLVTVVSCAFSMNVAASGNCGAEINCSEIAVRGETVVSTVKFFGCSELSGTYANGAMGLSFTFSYDETVFSYVSYSANIPATLETFATEAANGSITVYLAWDSSPDDVDANGLLNGINADDAISVDFRLKVLPTASFDTNSNINVSDVYFTDGSFKNVFGTGSTASMTVVPLYVNDDSVSIDTESGIITGFAEGTTYEDFFNAISVFADQAVLYDENNNVVSAGYSGYIGTGYVLKVTGGRTDGYTLMIKGDVNSDGIVSTNDYAAVKAYFKGNLALEGVYIEVADMNSNGIITTTDYIALLRKSAN